MIVITLTMKTCLSDHGEGFRRYVGIVICTNVSCFVKRGELLNGYSAGVCLDVAFTP